MTAVNVWRALAVAVGVLGLLATCGDPESDHPDLDQVIADASSSDPRVRSRSIHLLGSWFGKRAAPAVPVLTKALRDPDPGIVQSAARALGKIGTPAHPAVPELVDAMLRGQGRRITTACALAIGELGHDASVCVPALRQVLRDGVVDPATALLALSSFGPQAEAAVPEMIGCLRLGAESRKYALLALGSVGAPAEEAIPAIVSILDDPTQGESKSEALLALIEIGKPAVPILVDRVVEHGRASEIEAVGRIGSDARAATFALVDVLEGEERTPGAWEEAAWALGRIGYDESWEPDVVRALEGAAQRGVVRAREALAGVPGR